MRKGALEPSISHKDRLRGGNSAAAAEPVELAHVGVKNRGDI
ncbi:MAG: hypothetical protein ACTSYB_08735 [Candidatus Helarchaeota archaeon]